MISIRLLQLKLEEPFLNARKSVQFHFQEAVGELTPGIGGEQDHSYLSRATSFARSPIFLRLRDFKTSQADFLSSHSTVSSGTYTVAEGVRRRTDRHPPVAARKPV